MNASFKISRGWIGTSCGSSGRHCVASIIAFWFVDRSLRVDLFCDCTLQDRSPLLTGETRYKASTLRRCINQHHWESAQQEMRKWVWGGGKKLPGLILRRAAEARLLV